MPNPEAFNTYEEYMKNLWDQAEQKPDPRTVSRLVATEGCWMQVPDAQAATAKPDLGEIDSWAEKIEGTRAFGRVMESPKLPKRIADRDAEGLMTDLHAELTGRSRDMSERTAEIQQQRERKAPQKTAPDSPTL